MRASSPTKVAIVWGHSHPVWPRRLPRFVGEGHAPPAALAATQGSRDDASIVPYRGCGTVKVCGFPAGRGLSFRPGVCRYAKRRTSLCGRSVFLQQLETPVILRAFPGAYSSSRDSCARPCRGGPCRRQRRRGPGGWRKPQGRPGLSKLESSMRSAFEDGSRRVSTRIDTSPGICPARPSSPALISALTRAFSASGHLLEGPRMMWRVIFLPPRSGA